MRRPAFAAARLVVRPDGNTTFDFPDADARIEALVELAQEIERTEEIPAGKNALDVAHERRPDLVPGFRLELA